MGGTSDLSEQGAGNPAPDDVAAGNRAPDDVAAGNRAPDDVAGGNPAPDHVTPAAGFDAWRRRTTTGSIGSAVARALGDIFAPTDNHPVVSAPAPGDPPGAAGGVRVVLDPDDPTKSVAVFPAANAGSLGPSPDPAPGPGEDDGTPENP